MTPGASSGGSRGGAHPGCPAPPSRASPPVRTALVVCFGGPCLSLPPPWITNRQAVADDEIWGYHIPAGAVVGISPYVMHHLPAYWPEAERFNPQRFAPDAAHERPRFAYMPFGGGPHQCIGNSFALMEATLILASVAQRYRLRLPTGAVVTPQPKATLRTAGGLPMLLDVRACLLYTSPSPRDRTRYRMPSSA